MLHVAESSGEGFRRRGAEAVPGGLQHKTKQPNELMVDARPTHLKPLVADFLAFLVPHDLGLGVSGGLADEGGHAALDPGLVLRGSGESRGRCGGEGCLVTVDAVDV